MSRAPRTGADGGESGDPCGELWQRPCAWLRSRSRASAPAADIGANDDTGKFAADAGAVFFAPDGRPRAEAVRDDDAVRPERPDDDPGRGGARPRDSRRASSPASASRSPSTRTRRARSRTARRRRPAFAAWLTLRRAALPDREAVRRHERAEPAGVPAAAVRADGQDRLRGASRARSSRRGTTRSRRSTRRSR